MALCHRCDLPIEGDTHYPHDADRCTFATDDMCFCSVEVCAQCCDCDSVVGVECLA
jgi:hypothetical protein